MDPAALSASFQQVFERKSAARDKALGASRRSIRASANAIRAIHRGDLDEAHRLMEESADALRGGRDAVADEPDVRQAGFLQDAEKEFAEAHITEALVTGAELPSPESLEVDLAPYLNGMAEAVGEGRRAVLDLLRRGEFAEGERILAAMDDIYAVLVSMDFPDAITRNLRRSTDAARGIMERTRGDLSMSLVQRDLRDAIERHAKLVTSEDS